MALSKGSDLLAPPLSVYMVC